MNKVQQVFIDNHEVVRITVVEGVGIDAERGQLEDNVFVPTHPADQYTFAESPELEAMYDFEMGEWNILSVMQFFTDAVFEDEDEDSREVVTRRADTLTEYEPTAGGDPFPCDLKPDDLLTSGEIESFNRWLKSL